MNKKFTTQMPNLQKRRQLQTSLVVLVVVVIIVFGVAVVFKKPSTQQASATTAADPANSNPTSSLTPAVTSPTPAAAQTFKDGTYKATGRYDSPGGAESVVVTLTLQNGVVSSSLVQSGANDPTAAQFQDAFISGYKQFVVGKKITDVHLSQVSGSSLTSQGFNVALQNIERQAQS